MRGKPRSFAAAVASNPISIPPSRNAPPPARSSSKSDVGREANGFGQVCDLFPNIDRSTVDEVFGYMGGDSSKVIDYFLTMQAPSTSEDQTLSASQFEAKDDLLLTASSPDEATFSTQGVSIPGSFRDVLQKSGNLFVLDGANFFTKLPTVQLEMILKFMTTTDLARFSCLSHELHYIAEKILQKQSVLRCSSNWDDVRILGTIGRFTGLEILNLNKCENFQSFAFIPSALKTSKLTTLRLSRCRVSLLSYGKF
eukprot:TRINITY_DN7832_c0_g1_i2.p2 TRINITY_DN7832_c0_g1~~TRINITY_DN7832_c0_g1_i2.p2  ORF type:complete len:274 (-),score=65.01 TRINITY_DN7832_c0_g1_i2:852-1613(-)